MNRQKFPRVKFKQLFFLILLSVTTAAFSQEQGDSVYYFDKNWAYTDNIKDAIYFMQVVRENDSTYICRYYNNLSGMVRQESYLDSALTIPNGRFCWYNKNGMLDSTGLVYRKRKTGKWIYFDNDVKPVLVMIYNNGRFIEKKTFPNENEVNKRDDNNELLLKVTTMQNSVSGNNYLQDDITNTQWKQYLFATISVPERFVNITGNGSGEVIVSFTVNREGKPCDIYLKHSCEWSVDNEVFKAVKNGSLKIANKEDTSSDISLSDTVYFYSRISADNNIIKKDVFVGTRIEAKFPGGSQAWNRFLEKNLNPQIPADHNAPSGEYLVTVSFLVQKDGTVGDVKAINDPGYGTAEEAIRVFKKSPKWIPAMQDGVPVLYRQKQNMVFYVSWN